jgi:acylglycerol lipase
MPAVDVAALRNGYTGPHDLVRTSDGKILFVRRWDPKSNPKLSILIFHGITAYSGPYGPLIAEQLSEAGFTVYGLDLRGHGLSDGSRGDHPSQDRLVKDLSETVVYVKSKSSKLVLLGHSLGALSAIVAFNSSPSEVDGLILLSVAEKIRPGAYPKPKFEAVLKTLIGITLLRGTPLIEYRRVGMRGIDDPLFNFKYSARFYSVMYGTGALAVSRMIGQGVINSPNLKFKMNRLQIPLLVGVGDQDELFSVDSTKEFFDKIPCEDKEFLVFPGGHHAFFPIGSWTPLVNWLSKKF